MPAIILPLNELHVPEVARIHCQALAGDFLPSLGERFLRIFYHKVLDNNLGFGFVAYETEAKGSTTQYLPNVQGFILGSYDTSVLFRNVIKTSVFSLCFSALPAIFRHPKLIFNALETFFYPSKEGDIVEKAELLVIAIDQNYRGIGLGKRLVQALNQAFLTGTMKESSQEGNPKKISSYKVTVLERNQNANAFYQALGFTRASQFRLYGLNWNVYTYSL